MPNQRAAHLKELTLVIDKTILSRVEKLATELDLSRNKTLVSLISDAIKHLNR